MLPPAPELVNADTSTPPAKRTRVEAAEPHPLLSAEIPSEPLELNALAEHRRHFRR